MIFLRNARQGFAALAGALCDGTGEAMQQKTFEYMLENNRLRAFIREQMEVKPLRKATDVGDIPYALQIACGNGSSTLQILEYFSPARLSAVDRDEELIALACRNNKFDTVDFTVQDVFSLSFGDNIFDAVFDLADLHNYRDWQNGVMQLKRVLKRGGLLILEELSRETFDHAAGRLFKKLTEHPYDSMLTTQGFHDYVLQNGFDILHFEEKNPFGLLKYFVMVARKV
jgi:ubiquinone/menaquinone biosynthesis C-methylase UbiE